jgi:acyl-coenzyme A synthetase/AMP-(fatty) acid ligase
MYALKLMKEHDITFAKMTPSTISFIKPYFPGIRLESLRYCVFGGEPLVFDLASAWAQCVPNAVIHNVYGPTEVTINCMKHNFNVINGGAKSYNGIVSLGKPFGDTKAIILSETGKIQPVGKKGELCLAGRQVTQGYMKDEEKNKAAFFTKKIDGKDYRFYKTGDLAFVDKEGDYMYCGRIDNQVQIQGFRVELGEIESCARSIVKGNVAAVARKNFLGTLQIYLFIEEGFNQEKLLHSLKSKLPDYMVPSGIIPLHKFPINVSGKVDRKAMEEIDA